ncbi:response regulator transcription factor [Scytonema tolypothrichoides VB-61278]|nr:response regulator transcription factor [Scytonema tolypothrichoides VB-61278]
MAIRVLVADDHPIVREGLCTLLARQEDMEVVGEVVDGHALLAAVTAAPPDIVLLDLRMPGLDGLAVLRRLRQATTRPRVVVLSSYDESEHVIAAIAAGADAYLLKSSDYGQIITAIREVAAGERVISPSLVGLLFATVVDQGAQRDRQQAGLTEEAVRLLGMLADGLTNSEIAEQLHWSEVTVKRRLQEILDTLGARNRTQAVAEALRRGLL